MFLSSAFKRGDDSHERNSETQNATRSKTGIYHTTTPTSPSSPNFLCRIFPALCLTGRPRQPHAVPPPGLSRPLSTLTPVTQLTLCFSDGGNKGELGEPWPCSVRAEGRARDALMTRGALFDQKSRWLSLNITVSLPTNGISRLCYEGQRLVV